MKISELKKQLNEVNELSFRLPDGNIIPAHFHLTEIGKITKDFVDCGITVHHEKWATLQIWVADDLNHRLKPSSFIKIIDNAAEILGQEDLEIEVEYQTDTIGRYGLDFKDNTFILTVKNTDCLAIDVCCIPQEKPNMLMADAENNNQSSCTPGGSCC